MTCSLRRWSFNFSGLHSSFFPAFLSTVFISLSLSIPDDFSLRSPITDSGKFSKSSEQADKDKSEKGGLIGGSHRPASCPSPCFFSLYTPHSSTLSSLPPSAGNRALFRRRGDDKIKRKLHRVLLFDETGEVESRQLQTTFEKMGSGRREEDWTRARQTQTQTKGGKKPSGIWGHGRWGWGDWKRSKLEKEQNLYFDPWQRGGYCGGRKVLSQGNAPTSWANELDLANFWKRIPRTSELVFCDWSWGCLTTGTLIKQLTKNKFMHSLSWASESLQRIKFAQYINLT